MVRATKRIPITKRIADKSLTLKADFNPERSSTFLKYKHAYTDREIVLPDIKIAISADE